MNKDAGPGQGGRASATLGLVGRNTSFIIKRYTHVFVSNVGLAGGCYVLR